MAKVIILPLPAYGHVNPTLPLAQELVARGEDVSYCLVVIPQMLEQSITAKRVEELRLGIALERNAMTVDLLQEAVTRVASKPEFSTRVQHMIDKSIVNIDLL